MKQFSSNESRLSGVFNIFFGVASVEVFFFWLVVLSMSRKEHDPLQSGRGVSFKFVEVS